MPYGKRDWVEETDQQVEVLTAKLENWRLILGAHIVGGENQLSPKVVLLIVLCECFPSHPTPHTNVKVVLGVGIKLSW